MTRVESEFAKPSKQINKQKLRDIRNYIKGIKTAIKKSLTLLFSRKSGKVKFGACMPGLVLFFLSFLLFTSILCHIVNNKPFYLCFQCRCLDAACSAERTGCGLPIPLPRVFWEGGGCDVLNDPPPSCSSGREQEWILFSLWQLLSCDNVHRLVNTSFAAKAAKKVLIRN